MLRRSALVLLTLLPALFLAQHSARSSEAFADKVYVQVQDCSPDGKARPTFIWTGNDTNAAYQWLDLSLLNNDWAPGTFIPGGPLRGDTNLMGHPGLQPATVYYIRHVQQMRDGNFDFSPTYYFVTINCPRAATQASDTETPAAASRPGSASQPSTTPSGASTGAGSPAIVAPTTGSNCHPSYHGACLQINAGDYDCIGKGDGPLYVRGPIYLDGPDVFGLDDDGDGVACEP